MSATIFRFSTNDAAPLKATQSLVCALIGAVALGIAAAMPAAAVIEEIEDYNAVPEADEWAADATPRVDPDISDAGLVRRYLAALTVVASLLFVWVGLCAI